MKALTMTVLVVVVAAGTYFGLNVLMPKQEKVVAGQDNADALERIFGGSLQEAPIEPEPVPEDAAVAPVDPAVLDEAAAPETETPETGTETASASETETEEAATAEIETEPEVAPEPEPEPASEAAPAPAREAPKPAPAKPSASKSKKNQNPPPTWWGRSAPGNLDLIYAGSAAYKRAIVLMFDGDLKDAGALNRHVKVVDANGKAVKARWEINANNRRMAVLPVDSAGTYRVTVGAALSDAGGRTLGGNQQGPVRVP